MNTIFVRLIRAKPTFERIPHSFYADGQAINAQVVWASLYNKQSTSDVKAKPSMTHYIFSKYGFSEAFRMFFNFTPIVGNAATLKREEYPEEDWVFCSAIDAKPRGMVARNYQHSDIVVIIPRPAFTEPVVNMLAGFFYILSFFSGRFELASIDNPVQWRRFLGTIIFGSSMNHGMMLNKVDEHIRSLDEYIDEIMLTQFAEIGVPVKDIYEFFIFLIANFNQMMLDKDDKVATMYGKELSILYYLLDPIKTALVRFYFKLKSMKPEDINPLTVQKHLDSIVKPGTIFKITKDNGEVSPTSFPGDCAPFKLTTTLIPQGASSKRVAKGSKEGTSVNDPSQRCHTSIMEIGGHLFIPKNDPSGRSRINPFVQTDERGNVLRHEDLREALDATQEMIRRT